MWTGEQLDKLDKQLKKMKRWEFDWLWNELYKYQQQSKEK